MSAECPRRSRSKWIAVLVGVGLAAACGSSEGAPAALPQVSPTLDLAARILRFGDAALPPDRSTEPPVVESESEPKSTLEVWSTADVGEGEPTSLTQAVRLGPSALRSFLACPFVGSAVQLGCVAITYPMEERLVVLLGSAHDEDRALALAVLVRVRAPRYIDQQWRVLGQLEQRHGREPTWTPLLAAIREPFLPDRLAAALQREPLTAPLGEHRPSDWAARAVGVTKCEALLPQLAVRARSDNHMAAHAALCSLEEMLGPDADRALVGCLLAWGPGSERAARALRSRDPSLLTRTLLAAEVPAASRSFVGCLLAELEHPAAVPHLCATVGTMFRVDREMFDAIERLATVDHWPLVEAMPSTVRAEQQERAAAVVAAVRQRLKR